MRSKLISCFLLSTVVALTGCTSMLASDSTVEKKTAFTLGLDKTDFTISNRENNGGSVNYSVATKAGKKYNCYFTTPTPFTMLITDGSDAICSEIGGKSSANRNNSSSSCNALLQAAGKC